MPFTLSQLQAELQNHGYGTDTTTAQTAALNAGLRDVANWRRWPWDEGSGTVALVVGTHTYTPPVAMVEPDSIRLAYAGVGYDLDYLESDDLLDLQTDYTTFGTPQFWTYRNQKLIFWPTPDATYTATVQYSGGAVTLVNGSDTVNMPDNFINPVVWAALKHLAFRERDWDAVTEADRQFLQTIGRAAADLGMKQTGESSEVERSGFYDAYDGPVGII